MTRSPTACRRRPGYANDPVNTASGNFVELEDDLPFDGLTARAALRAHVQQPLRPARARSGRAGPRGPTCACIPRAEGAEYVGPDGQRVAVPAHGRGLRARAGRSTRWSSRARRGLVLRWFGGESLGRSTRPACRRASRAARAPTSSSRTRTGAWPSCATRGGRSVRVHWAGERIEALEMLGRAHARATATTRRATWSRPTARGRAHYEIGDAGRVLSVTDADGVVEVANAYDEQGRVLRQLSPFGRNTIFGYLPGHVTVTSDDTDGPTNVFIHDAHGPPASRCSPATRPACRFAYDAWRQPGRGHRPQGRRHRPGVGRARQPDPPRAPDRRRVHASPTTSTTASSRSPPPPARASSTPTTVRSAARSRSSTPRAA